MKRANSIGAGRRGSAWLFLALMALPYCSWASKWAAKDENGVSLNFVNADIEMVIRAVSRITNRNILVDPRVKGTLSVVTSTPVGPDTAYQILISALRMQGFSAIEENGIVKVIPEAEAKTHSLPVGKRRTDLGNDRIITHVFHLRHESSTQLLNVVRPLISPNNSVAAYPSNNTLIVTDYASNIERISKIIDALDVPQGDLVAIPLKHVAARDIAPTIGRLLGEMGSAAPGGQDAGQRVVVTADTRLNALLVRSDNPSRINSIRRLVANMDQPGAGGNIHVIYLRNADATKVAQTLRGVLAGDARGGTASASGTSVATAQAATGASGVSASGAGEFIQADRSTNSLIITAPESVVANIRQVVDQLDRRRAQVYVEALVAEVTTDNASEIGIQFQHSNLGNGGAAAFGGTNFASQGSNILALAANPLNASKGLNLAVAKGMLTLADGTKILNLAMLARFLETNAKTNILSTPNLMMLDNEEAKIVVGQNLPFVTGQYTNTGGGTTPANPFQTIERKDVGLTLRVKPQIAEGGALILQIFQESSSVVATTINSATGPVTNKRSIETTAVVDNGEFIVLGGLVQDSYTEGVDKVPLLGDIPVVGQLFRYDARQRSKTNLFVFLRPMIMRDSGSYQAMTTDRYLFILGQQQDVGSAGPRLPSPSDIPALSPVQVQSVSPATAGPEQR